MTGSSTRQLTDFIATISAADSRPEVLRLATERAAESAAAQVAVVIIGGKVAAHVGLPADGVSEAIVRSLAEGTDPTQIPGIGTCRVLASYLEVGPDPALAAARGGAVLVVARAGKDPYTAEQRALLRGMAQITSLTLGNLSALARERGARRASQREATEIQKRQRVLEALVGVQRMIVDRAPRQDILDRLVTDLARLVGDPVATLRLVERDGVGRIVAARGLEIAAFDETVLGSPEITASETALAEDRLVVIDDADSRPAVAGPHAAAAAPIRRDGKAVGSLAVASGRRGRRYAETELEVLSAFAEHATLAITDAARTSQMVHSALHDALTGLANRTLFRERLSKRLEGERRRRSDRAAVMFIDIDNLKTVNDTLGHSAGDEVLVEMAQRLTSCVRPSDTVARQSGDEFTILLDSVASGAAAVAIAERLLAAVREPAHVSGRGLTLGASIGVRMARAGKDRAEDVLRGADLAMYESKSRGGDRVALFHPRLDRRAQALRELEADLRAGLADGEFEVHYQPIVSLRDGEMYGIEALVRWARPGQGLVRPAEFISLAEERGLIVEIGSWVLSEACRTVVDLERRGGVPLRLSVNISGRQLLEPGLEEMVGMALAASGLAAERLTLEITESVLLTDAELTVDRLSALRELGVRIAIDDFGTGYSSLSYLRRLPLDSVKIDRSFIEHLTTNSRQAALVRAIVELCRSLGLETIAEGVESAAQARRLLDLGCTLAQGFHLGRPMAADDVLLILQQPVSAYVVAGNGRSRGRRAPEMRAASRNPSATSGGPAGLPPTMR